MLNIDIKPTKLHSMWVMDDMSHHPMTQLSRLGGCCHIGIIDNFVFFVYPCGTKGQSKSRLVDSRCLGCELPCHLYHSGIAF